ncbi:aminopeptidase P family protein [Pusillimonas sp. NJUB218]|uniref:aminopeptidase P family protein n=1 Tax=Pusillimonas sp. NJUB218 TaxID=2023230 RepID=UPI0021014FDB|nr:aminopeptidase P family protein [Pusillimonas sp. NJUB218]
MADLTPGSTPSFRLQALRQAMDAHGVDACVVLSADPHLSEYLPDHWAARAWLSGFEGSAGTLVVTAGFAGLWTDSRYWEQAVNDLEGSGIETMRAGAEGVPTPAEWLVAHLSKGAKVAVDGNTLAVSAHRQWQSTLSGGGLRLHTDLDLVGEVWTERPSLPSAPVFAHKPPHACRPRAANIQAVRDRMLAQGAGWHWLSSLDDIAWLLNLRGADVSYNPVFLAHVLLGADTVTLFVEPSKLSPELVAELAADGVGIESYDAIGGALSCLPESGTLLFDPARTTVGLLSAAAFVKHIEADNPSILLKACKTPEEIAHVRQAMAEDGAALCEFFAWFESALGNAPITELTIDEKITEARARRPGFVSASFSTIAAYNANGAMPHYHATTRSHARIEGDGLLLIDSGGQYLGGTTDITRVVPVGTPTPEQKRDFTLVLRGMIALSQAHFPKGIAAPMLDPIARLPLWQAGIEFGHGTGHGVGYFLNVHEGPQSISYRTPIKPAMAMATGMITSNEPGVYRPGQWGVRIENLVVCQPAEQTQFGEFMKFETLTLCPIDTRCIDASLLTPTDLTWLNDYHACVRQTLLPLVNGAARDWLIARTEPL